MRYLLAMLLIITTLSHAASITPEEQKIQTEFNKAYNNPDKDSRKTALAALDGAKHPSSWALLDRVAKNDPDPDVRLAAFTSLAKEPAHDTSVARMLVQDFSAIRFNDTEIKISYAKAMAGSEFKTDVAAAIGDHLSKMRYPDIPKYYPGGATGNVVKNPQAGMDKAKKDRGEFEEMLAAFNAVANSEVKSATKETPSAIGKWMSANMSKLALADRELADKYRKEDAEAAKAAKAAK